MFIRPNIHPITRSALLAAPIAIGLWALLVAFFSPTLNLLEEHATDWIWRQTASEEQERRVILIDIDENSLQQLGNWPWSRQRLGDLSNRLAAAGTALQIFDLVLPAPGNDDTLLAETLKNNNAVLAQVFALEDNTNTASGTPASPLPWAACPAFLPDALGHIANAPAYNQLPTGHITPRIGADGVIRHQPAIICDNDKAFPALFIAALNYTQQTPETRIQSTLSPGAPPWQLQGPGFTRQGIPLDTEGDVRIPWRLKPNAFISLSAADVLANRVPAGLLQNTWVLIGSTALGLNDRIATPFGGTGAGMLAHAQLLRGALDDSIPTPLRLGPLYQALCALISIAALSILAKRRAPPPQLIGLAISLCLILFTSKATLLTQYALYLNWVSTCLPILFFTLALNLVEYLRNRKERDRLYHHLASYLPASVAAHLVSQDPSDAIDATRTNATVMLADIRNFSAYCETNPPEAATAVLHAFFSLATRIVEAHGGQIESFQGDAVLAVWGSNGQGPQPTQALNAAREILNQSQVTLPPPQPDDLAPLALGIGLESGMTTIGSFGLARRRTHLALGHTVTTAARLQEMTVELAHPILIGEGMAANLGDHRLTPQGSFLLEGLKAPCHIYAYPLKECSAQ